MNQPKYHQAELIPWLYQSSTDFIEVKYNIAEFLESENKVLEIKQINPNIAGFMNEA